jgi:hypothetical protein
VEKPVVLKTVTTIAAEMHIPLYSSAIIAFLDGYHSRIGNLIARGSTKSLAVRFQAFRLDC